MHLLKQLLWPPASPPAIGIGDPGDRRWWIVTCVLLCLPLAAIAHHAILYRPTCMLNPFGGIDYSDLRTLRVWLSRDPSLPWAIATAFSIFYAGKTYPVIKLLAACFLAPFLPLAVWIWDIPFTGRFICEHAHDGRLHFMGFTVRSWLFYLLGVVLFLIFLALASRKRVLREPES
jgi:hypothetical protein